ncbi:hypothetical protein OAA86_08505 [Rhodospirillales bacterium]|nr:hypothetical protein [Rhodospirillales bacterium]
MSNQIEDLERDVARMTEKFGEDAQSTKLAMQQLDAHKARAEQRATGNYPGNPISPDFD